MKFKHLVEINDPLNPLIDTLTHDQLWQGLVLRAEMPTLFIPWMDRCEVLERDPGSMLRETHFGELVVRDRVTFIPQRQVCYHVPQQGDIPMSMLTMTIEEPQPGILYVRFEYDDGKEDTEEGVDAFYDDFRRSAYEEADIDTIRMIRQLAAEGRLDGPLM